MNLLFKIFSTNNPVAYVVEENCDVAKDVYLRTYPDAIDVKSEWIVNFIN